MQIRPAQPEDRDALLGIWLRSVRATHRFLTEADVQYLLPGVRDVALVELEIWVLTARDNPIDCDVERGSEKEQAWMEEYALLRDTDPA